MYYRQALELQAFLDMAKEEGAYRKGIRQLNQTLRNTLGMKGHYWHNVKL